MKHEIEKLLDEMTRLGRLEMSKDVGADTRRAARREMTVTSAKLSAAQSKARNEFAAARGWKFASKLFTVDYPVLDHCEHFLDRNRNLAAIVTHSYAPLGKVLEYAQRHRMRATELEFSWYNPGGCLPVLLEPLTGVWRRPRNHENYVRFEVLAA